MSKETYVGGDIIEWTGGNNLSFAKEEIINSSNNQVIQTGKEKGVSYGEPEDPPDITAGAVTLSSTLIRSYIEGNFEGSPHAYAPGNIGIEKNGNGGTVGENGDIISHPSPYGIVHYTKDNTPYVYEDKGKIKRYISCIPPMYKGYKTDDKLGLNGASTTQAYINSEEVAFIVTTFAPGTIKGDIGYIERINPNDGTVMGHIFCILADSNSSGTFVASELSVDGKKDVFYTEPTTKTKIKAQRLKTEISYFATKALGIKLSGALYVNQKTFNTNKNRYQKTARIDKYGNPIYTETITNNKFNDILNFYYIQNDLGLPYTLDIKTGYVEEGVEVFKFEGVTDEYAVLRIRIFRNSGDGHAHTQTEINDAGNFYKDYLIDKKEAYINNYFTEKNK